MNISEAQKQQLAATLDEMIEEHFTSKPGWNWPPESATQKVFDIDTDDEKLSVTLVVERILEQEEEVENE